MLRLFDLSFISFAGENPDTGKLTPAIAFAIPIPVPPRPPLTHVFNYSLSPLIVSFFRNMSPIIPPIFVGIEVIGRFDYGEFTFLYFNCRVYGESQVVDIGYLFVFDCIL